tara:strand:- start:233 stop:418 length:186 start_codon:yes stop_codon:yes gene_type:complete
MAPSTKKSKAADKKKMQRLKLADQITTLIRLNGSSASVPAGASIKALKKLLKTQKAMYRRV